MIRLQLFLMVESALETFLHGTLTVINFSRPFPHAQRNRNNFIGTSGCQKGTMSPSSFNFVDAKDKFTVGKHRTSATCKYMWSHIF